MALPSTITRSRKGKIPQIHLFMQQPTTPLPSMVVLLTVKLLSRKAKKTHGRRVATVTLHEPDGTARCSERPSDGNDGCGAHRRRVAPAVPRPPDCRQGLPDEAFFRDSRHRRCLGPRYLLPLVDEGAPGLEGWHLAIIQHFLRLFFTLENKGFGKDGRSHPPSDWSGQARGHLLGLDVVVPGQLSRRPDG